MILEGITEDTIHGKELCEKLLTLLESSKSEYASDLIPDLSYINNRAECVTGIEIESVEYHCGNDYTLNYKFDWSVYNGCADMDEMDTIHTHVSFSIEYNGFINFDLSCLEERSTAGEL